MPFPPSSDTPYNPYASSNFTTPVTAGEAQPHRPSRQRQSLAQELGFTVLDVLPLPGNVGAGNSVPASGATNATATPTHFRVNASFYSRNVTGTAPSLAFASNSGGNGLNFAFANVNAAFAELTGLKMSIVPGSLERGPDMGGNKVMASFIARPNHRTRPLADARQGKLVLAAANVFMDKEDQSYWKLEGSGKDAHLAQNIQDDLSALLESRVARTKGRVVTASAGGRGSYFYGTKPSTGDYGLYYDTQDNALRFGFMMPVTASVTSPLGAEDVLVTPRGDNGKALPARVISSGAVIACVNLGTQRDGVVPEDLQNGVRQVMAAELNALNHQNQTPVTNITPARETVHMGTSGAFTGAYARRLLDYMGALYGKTDFFSSLESLVMRQRGLAHENTPRTTMRTNTKDGRGDGYAVGPSATGNMGDVPPPGIPAAE